MQSRREALLLILAFIFIAAGYLALALAPAVRQAEWEAAEFQSAFAIGLTLWSASAFLGHYTLNRKAPFRDPFLFPVAMFLVGWGLVLIQRLAPGFGVRQSIWLAIGTLVLTGVLFAPPDLRWLRRFLFWCLSFYPDRPDKMTESIPFDRCGYQNPFLIGSFSRANFYWIFDRPHCGHTGGLPAPLFCASLEYHGIPIH